MYVIFALYVYKFKLKECYLYLNDILMIHWDNCGLGSCLKYILKVISFQYSWWIIWQLFNFWKRLYLWQPPPHGEESNGEVFLQELIAEEKYMNREGCNLLDWEGEETVRLSRLIFISGMYRFVFFVRLMNVFVHLVINFEILVYIFHSVYLLWC